MNIANLKPGDVLRRADRNNARRYTFTEYSERADGQGKIAILQCAEFVGLHGPNDKGLCEVATRDLARQFERVSA